jgi:hypothetical protein
VVIRLDIDPNRCKATGVRLSISPGHLRIADGTAHTLPDTSTSAAAECCPGEAITVVTEPLGGAVFTVDSPIATLGPAGTDAQAEAVKHSSDVRLVDSFADAMALARGGAAMALIAAGYIERDGDRTVDSWSDQHFTHHRELRVARLWESRTKTMCIALRHSVADVTQVRSVAVHPATAALLDLHHVPGRRVFVNAKPHAAAAAAGGQVDACIASLDVVTDIPELRVVARIDPTMVWLLYTRRSTR